MKIATWNVNSIRARLERVMPWLRSNQPDVLCIQETKVEDTAFPRKEFEAEGYTVTCHGQKTYNGVAFISREPPSEIIRGMGDGDSDPEARFLVGRFRDLRIGNVYVPNGQDTTSLKFGYKLGWLERWRTWLNAHMEMSSPWLFCGDINIAPTDMDVHDPEAWRNQVLCHPLEREALSKIISLGFVDLFRQHHPEAAEYSWWDYRQLAFPRNRGLRIDHIFCTPPLVARSTGIVIDRDSRKGPTPSDHAPVVAVFSDS